MTGTRQRWVLAGWLRLSGVLLLTSGAVLRVVWAWAHAVPGNPSWVGGLGFGVLFPLLLALPLLGRHEAVNAEGAFLRAGTAIHLLLIICLPSFALQLALGLPCVFLVVELVTRYAPARCISWLDRHAFARADT